MPSACGIAQAWEAVHVSATVAVSVPTLPRDRPLSETVVRLASTHGGAPTSRCRATIAVVAVLKLGGVTATRAPTSPDLLTLVAARGAREPISHVTPGALPPTITTTNGVMVGEITRL